jgi:hypothetical protein
LTKIKILEVDLENSTPYIEIVRERNHYTVYCILCSTTIIKHSDLDTAEEIGIFHLSETHKIEAQDLRKLVISEWTTGKRNIKAVYYFFDEKIINLRSYYEGRVEALRQLHSELLQKYQAKITEALK